MATREKSSGKEAQTREAGTRFLQASDRKTNEKESLVSFVDRKLTEEKKRK